jgi:hypothetical protein
MKCSDPYCPLCGDHPLKRSYTSTGVEIANTIPYRMGEFEKALARVRAEYLKCRQMHSPHTSPHQSWGLAAEEFDEFKEAIRANNLEHAKLEAIQTATMLLAFVAEVDRV